MRPSLRLIVTALMACGLCFAPAEVSGRPRHHDARHRGARKSARKESKAEAPAIVGTQLRLNDGSAFAVDDAWEDAAGVWYRKNGVTQLLERSRVRAIERGDNPGAASVPDEKVAAAAAPDPKTQETDSKTQPVWIYLAGGARVEADEATESPAGVWYTRGPLSVFIEKSRVERIERETAIASSTGPAKRGWSSGNPKLDGLIRQSGARHGVDPYLIFLVMEEESHFNAHVVSPKGARGLMQLMPGTGARFGVRHPFNASESVEGGTRYLKQLLQKFNGRIDLALASYNSGEGAVVKFGMRVPPYRETQNYVRRISKRYGRPRTAEINEKQNRREGGQ
jgi:soluble lytic murein transglycosylase-like protein